MSLIVDRSREEIVTGLTRLESELRAHGVVRLAIFGSRARGDHRPDSDLDVLIDVEPGRKFSLLDVVGVSHIISDRLGIPANIFMRRSLQPDMAAAVRPDMIEIF